MLGTTVIRHALKFLLFLVRALVLAKRFLVWLGTMIGHFFVWASKPLLPYVIVPLYRLMRRLIKQFEALSPDPRERWVHVLTGRSVVISIVFVLITAFSVAAAGAPQRAGIIPGAHTMLLTKFIGAGEADWQSSDDEQLATAEESPGEGQRGVVYRAGGSVAFVFPYQGRVGIAPAAPQEAPSQPPQKQKKPYERYAVQRGDSIARIAKKFGVTQETILAANNLTRTATVRAGDTLVVPTEDGVLYTVKFGGTPRDVARKFGASATVIARANGVSDTHEYSKGDRVLVPGVTPTVVTQAPAPTPVLTPAPPKPKQEPEPEPEPTPAPSPKLENGEAPPPPVETPVERPDVVQRPQLSAGEKMFWPSSRRTINQYFSAYHPGLDIDGDYSDSVFATDDGTVIYSGWINNGYGNMVLIDHGNGLQSRYGHNSRVFVSVGQFVHKGDVIARVGTTGRSTGSHLHFEIMLHGKRVNPLKYVR